MVLSLIHELGHYYGIAEVYAETSIPNEEHQNNSSTICVMKRLGRMMPMSSAPDPMTDDFAIQNMKKFYESILANVNEPFCQQCRDKLFQNGVYASKYIRRNYE